MFRISLALGGLLPPDINSVGLNEKTGMMFSSTVLHIFTYQMPLQFYAFLGYVTRILTTTFSIL